VVRIGDQIMVETQKWKRLLRRCHLQPGHAVDLGTVWLRQVLFPKISGPMRRGDWQNKRTDDIKEVEIAG
jgi:hypothetical protein